MTLLLDGSPDVRPEGIQSPRIESIPPFVASAGAEALEVAELAGLFLDPWQQHVLRTSLNERGDGKWAAPEIGLIVPRQNGKGAVLEARELAGLFLLGERFIVHSAHQFDTSLDAFRRLLEDIEGVPEFDRRIRRVSRSHGEEGIELRNGQRIRFRTRTKGGGRGFTGDCLILDEAMELPETAVRATIPTLRARPNPQTWYVGSAVDKETMDNGIVLAGIRERGLKGGDERLAFFEWSADLEMEEISTESIADRRHWERSNPALGIRVSSEQMHGELATFAGDLRGFAVELLGVGDWPSSERFPRVIPLETWRQVCGSNVAADPAIVFAIDANPERTQAGIVAVGDGPSVEVVEYRSGVSWLAGRVLELWARHRKPFVVDARGPAGSLVGELEAANVELLKVTALPADCGLMFDRIMENRLKIRMNPDLDAAMACAVKHASGDAWRWDRKHGGDICLLVAATIGVAAVVNRQTASMPEIVSL